MTKDTPITWKSQGFKEFCARNRGQRPNFSYTTVALKRRELTEG